MSNRNCTGISLDKSKCNTLNIRLQFKLCNKLSKKISIKKFKTKLRWRVLNSTKPENIPGSTCLMHEIIQNINVCEDRSFIYSLFIEAKNSTKQKCQKFETKRIITNVLSSVIPVSIPSYSFSAIPNRLPIIGSIIPTSVPNIPQKNQPSSIPSDTSSVVPSLSPSIIPSSILSLNPSSTRSRFPSVVPSVVPNNLPSVTSSNQSKPIPIRLLPTPLPSGIPSSASRATPSITSSWVPSAVASNQPSSVPSAVQILLPSVIPSTSPNTFPSSIPSSDPSSSPSSIPKSDPSSSPSSVPSTTRSKLPSVLPSTIPSTVPSSVPSTIPTLVSGHPSSNPISIPSISPSAFPSSIPSLNLYPSTTPSAFPFVVLNDLPSMFSSSQPSLMPSVQLSALKASDGSGGDNFGKSVAISNDYVVVGAPKNNENGKVYIFDPLTSEVLQLIASDGEKRDKFGHSVAISNDFVVVGAHRKNENGKNSGSAYIFNAKTGEEVYKLIPSDGTENDQFGLCVAISGDLVVIGAHWSIRNSNIEGYENSGSAYIFNATNGEQLFKLKASDVTANDQFGKSVAISNNLVVVGTNRKDMDDFENLGSAYIFSATTGKQIHKLIPPDLISHSFFGRSVAIANGLVVVAAFIGVNHPIGGLAYIFNATSGVELHTLKTTDKGAGSISGWSVGISNNLVVIGAVGHGNDNNSSSRGLVYIFNATTGEQIRRLESSKGSARKSVAISNSLVAMGDGYVDNNGLEIGSVYTFNYTR